MVERYTIILEEDVPVDPRKFGDAVATVLGVTKLEARMAVRKGRGIFLENLEEEPAQRIAEALRQEGIPARTFSHEQIPALPRFRRIMKLNHGDELLAYVDPATEEEELLPWDAVLAVSCGVVANPQYKDLFSHVPFTMVPPMHKLEGEERDLVRENLLLKMAAPPPKDEKKRKPESIFEEIESTFGSKVKVYVDVCSADLGTWLRVSLDDVAYQYMPDSVRMGGAWGFQLLMNDLRDKCGDARSPLTLQLLEATDIKELVFPQVEEFNRLSSWFALKRYLWPTADSSSPSPEPPGSPTDGASSSASPEPEPPSTSS